MNVSVIIPTMKGREALLKRLLDSIPEGVEVIVVPDEDILLAAKRNKGARLAKGKYLLFIDDDNYLKDFAIKNMLESFTEEIGVMGMVACYDDKKMIIADGGSERFLLTGFTNGLYTNCSLSHCCFPSRNYEVDEVANAFMIRRDVFEDAGGFDEKNFPIDLDEADLCKRIKDMGYKIVMNPRAVCYHKSITYSHFPTFRREMNAYTMGRHRVVFQRIWNNRLRYCVYLVFFMPVFVVFYLASLSFRKNFKMIKPFLKGVLDGVLCRKDHPYRKG